MHCRGTLRGAGGRVTGDAFTNNELMRSLREQEEIVVAEWLKVDRRVQAQMREFANLTAELMARRQGPEVQLEGMHIGVKVKKPENYDGSK